MLDITTNTQKPMTDSVGKELFKATINPEKCSGAVQSVTTEGGEKRLHDRIRWGNTQRSINTTAEQAERTLLPATPN